MEGYFPTHKYCELTGEKINTVRVLAKRGKLDCFKNKNGRWFIYYSDEEKAIRDKGYISIEEFASIHGVHRSTVEKHLNRLRIKDPDVLIVCKIPCGATITKRVFVKRDAAFKAVKRNNHARPGDEWLTVMEWCKREGAWESTTRRWMKDNLITYAENEGQYFILNTETKEKAKLRMRGEYDDNEE